MSPNLSLAEYQVFITTRLRAFEERRAAGDPEKLRLLASMPDSMLLRKWLLIVSGVGFPISFVVLFLLGMISPHLPAFLSTILWVLAKGAMGITFLIFLLGIYLTLNKSDGDGR
ncbi:MAG: hypothetical protein JST44_05580 [Cyanobacteria bacterium SZAS LIN-5]|nr:hypothetical protein [Cyanobacteria bacterium SZAS LIN-5]